MSNRADGGLRFVVVLAAPVFADRAAPQQVPSLSYWLSPFASEQMNDGTNNKRPER